MIPFYKISVNHKEISSIKSVFKSKYLIQSNIVKKFEDKISKYTGVKYCSVVSSGTAALHTVFIGLNLDKNDGVLIPDYAWPSAANVVALMGGIVISVDVSKTTYNMTPETLKKAIDKSKSNGINIKYLVLIHQFGLISDVEEILDIAEKNKLTVVEDAACALGATYKGQKAGTFGDVAIFSFHPRKTITTGEGGAIVTNNEILDKKFKVIRNHGQELQDDGTRKFILPGLNYRMTEFQAAMGISQLEKLDKFIEKKIKLVETYNYFLEKEILISVPKIVKGHIYQTYMVTINENKYLNLAEIISKLSLNGIEAIRGSAAIQNLDFLEDKTATINSDFLISNGLALPLYPGLSKKKVKFISSKLSNIVNSNGS